MANRPSSEDQLGRILQLLPLAAAEEGVRLDELARRLGRSETEIIRDLGEVIGRSYYRPAGEPDDVSVLIEPDYVEVWTTSEFRRPPRLNRREALALGLALRMLSVKEVEERGASGADGDRAQAQPGEGTGADPGAEPGADPGAEPGAEPDRERAPEPERAVRYTELAARLEERLTTPAVASGPPAPIEIGIGAIAPSEIHDTLTAAARDRRRCRIRYLRSGAAEPETRDIDPYVVLIAGGRWYVVGYCHAREELRVFRIDRVLEVERLADTFAPPEDFDPGEYISEGRVYRAEEFEEVVVRYTPRVARWIAEQGPVETLPDGGVQVRYSVADPRWAVRHVLEHAPEAEVVSPARIRALVRATALALVSG